MDNIHSMEIDGDVLTVNLDETHSMSFENYQGLKYIKNGNGTLYNFIDAGKVRITDPVYPDGTKKNKTVKGTIYSDTIDARGSSLYDKNGLITDNSKKGFTIDGRTGNDTIYGSIYSDVIKYRPKKC